MIQDWYPGTNRYHQVWLSSSEQGRQVGIIVGEKERRVLMLAGRRVVKGSLDPITTELLRCHFRFSYQLPLEPPHSLAWNPWDNHQEGIHPLFPDLRIESNRCYWTRRSSRLLALSAWQLVE